MGSIPSIYLFYYKDHYIKWQWTGSLSLRCVLAFFIKWQIYPLLAHSINLTANYSANHELSQLAWYANMAMYKVCSLQAHRCIKSQQSNGSFAQLPFSASSGLGCSLTFISTGGATYFHLWTLWVMSISLASIQVGHSVVACHRLVGHLHCKK